MKESEKSKIVNYGINFLIGIIYVVLLLLFKEKILPIVRSRVSAKKLEMVAYVILLLVDIYFLGHVIYDLIKLKTGKLKAEPLDHETERDKYKKDLISYIVTFIFLTLFILIYIRLYSFTSDNKFLFDNRNRVSATVIEKEYYGPPNYGETQELDAKEIESIICFEEPQSFNVKGCSIAIKEMQLVFYKSFYKDSDCIPGKRYSFIGRVVPAETGHHHTDYIFLVDDYNLEENQIE